MNNSHKYTCQYECSSNQATSWYLHSTRPISANRLPKHTWLTLWHFWVSVVFLEELIRWFSVNFCRTHCPAGRFVLHGIILNSTPELWLMPTATIYTIYQTNMSMFTVLSDSCLLFVKHHCAVGRRLVIPASVCNPTIWQPGFDLPRQTWTLVNRFYAQAKAHVMLVCINGVLSHQTSATAVISRQWMPCGYVPGSYIR